jgi:hypothetical protein
MHSAGVVADANVLLSAALGKAAARVIFEFAVPIHVARFNADEVERYLSRLAAKYRLPSDVIEMQWLLLPKADP